MDTPRCGASRIDAGPVELEGRRANSVGEFLATLVDGDEVGLLAADLSLGAWRGHQVATEFAAQLNLSLLDSPAYRMSSGATLSHMDSYADAIAHFIEAEGRGQATILSALQLAKSIADAAKAANV